MASALRAEALPRDRAGARNGHRARRGDRWYVDGRVGGLLANGGGADVNG